MANNFGTIQMEITPQLVKKFLMSDCDTVSDFLDELLGIREVQEDNGASSTASLAHYAVEKWINRNIADINTFVLSGEMLKGEAE